MGFFVMGGQQTTERGEDGESGDPQKNLKRTSRFSNIRNLGEITEYLVSISWKLLWGMSLRKEMLH
jgi:hypothetical protein